MKFVPKLEEVKKIAGTGEYKVLPVSCEILSDICTPIEALRILKNISTHCYMLKAGEISIKTDDPDAYLRQILAEYKSPRLDYLPSFTGGLVGYFSDCTFKPSQRTL